MPWRGRRLILVAFTIRNPEKLKREHLEFLESVGFRPPRASEALPDLSSDPAGHFPLRAIGAPLSSSELRARFELPPVKDPPAHLAPSHVRAFGSLRVEPRVVASGSPRVELSRPAEPVVSPPRSLAPQAGLDLPHDGLPKPLLDFLLRLPPGRFVFSDVFADLRSALSSGPGWLDLFSGSRGLAREVARAAPWWVLCYDILHGFDEDLLNLEVQREIFFLLAEGAFRGFSAGPVCSSFSAAITPAWRTSEFPEGVPWLTPVQRGKVQSGNEMLSFILNLSAESERLGLLYLIENPLNSWFWKQTAWRSWERDSATTIASLELRGKSPLGSGATGNCKGSGFAAPGTIGIWFYEGATRSTRSRGPNGLKPTRGASVFCWPRLLLRTAEPLQGSGSLTLCGVLSAAGRVSVRRCGPALDRRGSGLPLSGKPLQHYRQLLALAQRKAPLVRPHIRQAWEMLTRWERLEPTKHRPPMPEAILEAMCSLALAWGWFRWVLVTMLAFYGCCRIGEVLKALRCDLFTPGDLLRCDTRFALQFNEPKTRTRGARVQHTTINFRKDIAEFVVEICERLPRSSRLFYGSPSVYRRRWDVLLSSLGIAQTFRLTPGSLRGGGAVAAYQAGCSIPDIQWRMRIQHQATLSYYLQEVAAGSLLPALPRHAREAIQAARAVFSFSSASAQRSCSTALRAPLQLMAVLWWWSLASLKVSGPKTAKLSRAKQNGRKHRDELT